jgi:two-component system NtrC family sensor kinase
MADQSVNGAHVAEVLADVTGCLAVGISSDDGMVRAADALVRRGVAVDVGLWVRSRGGEVYQSADSGRDPIPVESMRGWLQDTPETRGGAVSLRAVLETESGPLGLIEVQSTQSGAETARAVLPAVANSMSVWLASAELSQDLASEVAYRTREIDEHRRFTAQIIDSLPVGLYVVDRNYRIQAWNRKRETGTQGISRGAALGKEVFEVLTRQPSDMLRAEFDAVFKSGSIERMDVESLASGEPRHFRISKIPMRLNEDEVTHVITIGEDVTEWKTVHEQISQTDKLAAVGQMAAGVMHELNNPLATIGACIEALTVRMPDLAPDDQRVLDEYLQIIESELERCNAIINGLLDFSHPKSHVKQPGQINSVVEDSLFLIKHHDKFRRIKLVRRLAENLPDIHANAKQLIQVFLAIMLNAIDAMDGEGTLTVTTGPNPERDDEVLLEFSDTGLGIPREDLSKIFEPFFTTKVTGRGTGLGLSICYAVVQEHRGRIVVDSQLGTGATFRVFLPRLAPPRVGA